MTVNSSRRSEPMLPANASPKLRPDADLKLGPAGGAPARVELLELVNHLDRRGHRLVGVVGAADRRAPLRHHGVADELVERSVMTEHAIHHLREVLGEQARHVVRPHRLGQRGEAANVAEQHGDGPLVAAEPDASPTIRRFASRAAA